MSVDNRTGPRFKWTTRPASRLFLSIITNYERDQVKLAKPYNRLGWFYYRLIYASSQVKAFWVSSSPWMQTEFIETNAALKLPKSKRSQYPQ